MLKYLKIRTLLNLKTQPISIVYIQIQNRADLLRTMDELAVDPSISRNIITQDEDPTVALVVTTEERPTKLVLPPVVEHECFHILLGRSKGIIGTKNDRIKLIHDVLLLDVSEYLPPHLWEDPSIKKWIYNTSLLDKNPSKWNLNLLARAICDFDIILTKCKTDVAILEDSRPRSIVTFEDYMDSAREISNLSLLQKPRVRKGQIGKQKVGEIMQETYSFSDLEGRQFDFETCASCNHRFLLPVGIDIK